VLGVSHVADYARRLSVGAGDGAELTNNIIGGLVKPPTPFSQCPDANVSVCATSASAPFVAVVYNPLPRPGTPVVRIPVSSQNVAVSDANGTTVPSQVSAADEYSVST
jgi:hypothetical protein